MSQDFPPNPSCHRDRDGFTALLHLVRLRPLTLASRFQDNAETEWGGRVLSPGSSLRAAASGLQPEV